MVNVLTSQEFQYEQDQIVPASGHWDVTLAFQERRQRLARILDHIAGLAAILAVSSMTCGADPWLMDRRRQTALTLEDTFETLAGRPISIFEARQIALSILMRAEQERASFADDEAQHGIDWEFDQ